MNLGQWVWFDNEMWMYLGWGEDGAIQFCRPLKSSTFPITEFNTLYPVDEPEAYNDFMEDNGESFIDKCKRKGIEIPKEFKDGKD